MSKLSFDTINKNLEEGRDTNRESVFKMARCDRLGRFLG